MKPKQIKAIAGNGFSPGGSISFALDYPPTGNHAVIHAQGAHYLTNKVKSYYATTRMRVELQGAKLRLAGRLQVEAHIWVPDKRKRDLDNVWKIAGDACTRAGVWIDDTQIDHLTLIRAGVRVGGAVDILVTILPDAPE